MANNAGATETAASATKRGEEGEEGARTVIGQGDMMNCAIVIVSRTSRCADTSGSNDKRRQALCRNPLVRCTEIVAEDVKSTVMRMDTTLSAKFSLRKPGFTYTSRKQEGTRLLPQ
jgi:hypothetical protein